MTKLPACENIICMLDGSRSPDVTEGAPHPEVKQKSPFTETQVRGIVGVVGRKLTQMFAGPFAEMHADNAEGALIGLQSKASDATNEHYNVERLEKEEFDYWKKDYPLLQAVMKDHPLAADKVFYDHEEMREIVQQVELMKQSKFIDEKMPQMLQNIRKETMLSYLALRDARDRAASPKDQKRLEEMFQRQREILKEIAPYRNNPSQLLKENLKESLKCFQDNLRRDTGVMGKAGKDGVPKNFTPETGFAWLNVEQDKESIKLYSTALKNLEAKYPDQPKKEPVAA